MRETCTFKDRMDAAIYMKMLRDKSNRADVSKILGISQTYITTIEHRTRRKRDSEGNDFSAPAWAVNKVNNHYRQTQSESKDS